MRAGYPNDAQAREFVANLVTRSGLANVTSRDVLAASAMEARGFLSAVYRQGWPPQRVLPQSSYLVCPIRNRNAVNSAQQPDHVICTFKVGMSSCRRQIADELRPAACRFNAAPSTQRQLPSTIIRSASDHDSNTVERDPGVPGVWWEGDQVAQDVSAGYSFAIGTASTAVLSMLKLRCQQGGGATSCDFSLAP